jgi:hypothetical protein
VIEFGRQIRDGAGAALHGIGHHRPHVAQAAQVAYGIGHGPSGKCVMQRPEPPDSLRHPGRAMEPDEGCVLASSRRRDQNVDEVRGGPSDAVLLESGRTGDHAAATRVEHGGHLLLDDGGRPGRSQVDAGDQALPRVPETMPERTRGDACGERLTAGDYI